MTLAAGSRIGQYEIRGSIGSGGMGEVYRAHDPRLGRDVALKILPDAMAKDPEGLERFTREARAVAALNHPHIVTIFSTEEADGVRFMTMELIEGRTLDQMIPASGVSLAQFFDVSTALADALSAAHQKQITHRDLKPANVMVSNDGRVKVLDFGLARAAAAQPGTLEEEATRQRLTQAGTILGTMPYMSPEQIEAKALDHRTDIFSLGIMMFEMVTGGRPFRGDTSPALMSSIMREHPKAASEIRADLPGDVSQLIGRCMEKQARDRVQTAQEILIELKAQRRAWESGASSLRPRPTAGPSPKRARGEAPRGSELRIAVLPFTARPSGGDPESLADGLTEDIAAGLLRFPNLRVVSLSNASRVKGQAADASTAAQVGARYLLDGSVRGSGTSVRVSARLVDASTGIHMWAETFERSLAAGVFALQDDVGNRVIASVADSNGVLVRSMGAALKDRPWPELSNPELLIRAEAYFQRYRPDEHAVLRDAFEAAVERDPLDAQAWACLGMLVAHEHSFGINPRPDSHRRSREAANRALELDSTCSRGWVGLGLSDFLARDRAGVLAAAEKVIAINPLDTSKLAAAAIMLFGVGEVVRACAVARQAMSLHSHFAGWYRAPLMWQRYLAGEYVAALADAKGVNIETLRLGYSAAAAAAGQVGSAADARAAIDALARIDGRPPTSESERAQWSMWIWDETAVDHFMEGFDKALALATPEVAGKMPSGASNMASGPSRARVASGKTSPIGASREFSIVVNPFTASTAGSEVESLFHGLAEDVATGLSRFPYLTVQTSKDADARYVLNGSVRRSGDAVRFSVRLVDSDSGAHLWAENYDRTLKDKSLFDVQDDLTARVVTSVAGDSGALVRAMATPLLDRPIEELSPLEVVLRYHLFSVAPRIDEHARLREGLERMLATHPNHALGWACLSMLYALEASLGLNPLPDSQGRAYAAARRSVEIDPGCQLGWQRLVGGHFHSRDGHGLLLAAERVMPLNPLNQSAAMHVGMMLAVSGEWERGVSMIRRAMDIDPNHLGIFHIVLFIDHYRLGKYEDALAQVKRTNMSETALSGLSLAAAAGQLGRANEALASLESLRRDHPDYLPTEKVRSIWEYWLRDHELIERLVEGFTKAQALVQVEPRTPSGASKKPTSGASPAIAPATPSATMSGTASGRSASIAVLPFSDMSATKDQEWFCDGIAEEVLNALSQLKGLRVAARTSAFSFRGKSDDLKAIGEKLHVTTVLDGSVRRSGDRVRITVQLSDVANGYQLWSERYDRDLKDIFDVQDEIAKAISEKLRVTLAGDEEAAPRVVRHTENQEAYHLYLRGRYHWYARSKGAVQKAVECYEQAIAKDPDYPLPYVGLSDAFTIQALYGYEREVLVLPRAQASLARALTLNDRLADAYRAQGFMYIFLDWGMKAAVRALERSLELDPSSGLAHIWLGWPTWPGRDETAMAAAGRAQELDPLNVYVISLVGMISDFYGRAEEGVREVEKALEMDPGYFVGLYAAGGIYSRLGRHDDALRMFERGVEISGRTPFYLSYLAWAQARAGQFCEARAGLAELERRSRSEYVQPLQRAIVHAALGDMDRAFELLAEAVTVRNPWISSPRMPMFDGFRGDPRFAEHLRRIGHPDADLPPA